MLEDEFHDRVLLRVGREVKLTDAGRILVDLAQRINRDIASAGRQIMELNQLSTGHIRIGTGTPMLMYLQHVAERFQREFPGIEICVVTETAEHLIQEISKQTVDLGIILVPTSLLKGKWDVEYEPLYKEEFVFVVSRQHPLGKEEIVSLSDLIEYPFIVYAKGTHLRKMLEHQFAKAQLVPKITMELETEESVEKMLAGSNKIGLLSKRRATGDHLHWLRTKEGPMYCQVAMFFPRAAYIPTAVKEFACMCRKVAASGR